MGSRQREGRGIYRGGSRYQEAKKEEPNWPSGKLIKLISLSNLAKVGNTPRIENCDYLASYNWLDQLEHPTILVPGMEYLRGVYKWN